MAEDNTRHMNYLQYVTDGDVKALKEKERTYKGSWKKRGGVGAAMMILRKVDRLENMLEERGFDIFKEPGHGADGSPIAEIRDLRRYLVLVEAEMMARGMLAVNGLAPMPEYHPSEINAKGEYKPAQYRPGTPEDGGQHARHRMPERLMDGMPSDSIDLVDKPKYLFVNANGAAIGLVDRNIVEPILWEHLPRLPHEQNAHEFSQLPPEYQYLYDWNEGLNKYLMNGNYLRDWGRG